MYHTKNIFVKLCLIFAILTLCSCASYPNTEAEISACLAEPDASFVYCTQHYARIDAAKARKARWLLSQGAEAFVEIRCGGGRSVTKRVKDIRGNECTCPVGKIKKKGC